MIRANLLPRPQDAVTVLGVRLDVEYLRAATTGIALVAFVALVAFAIENARVARVVGRLERANDAIAARSEARALVETVEAKDARYRAIDRRAAVLRESGDHVALQLATIGNSVPRGVWLEAIDRDASGYAISGGSATLADVGESIAMFARLPFSVNAQLVSIDGRGILADTSYFRARIALANVEAQ